MSMLSGAQRAKHKRERHPHDWYVEPPEVSDWLFREVRFTGPFTIRRAARAASSRRRDGPVT
jgi:hypothetical protein